MIFLDSVIEIGLGGVMPGLGVVSSGRRSAVTQVTAEPTWFIAHNLPYLPTYLISIKYEDNLFYFYVTNVVFHFITSLCFLFLRGGQICKHNAVSIYYLKELHGNSCIIIIVWLLSKISIALVTQYASNSVSFSTSPLLLYR